MGASIEHKYGATGIILPLFGRRQVELWFSPPMSNIPLHIHPGVDSYIIHIWGRVLVKKEKKERTLPRFSLFRGFSIPSLISHGFTNYNNWFIFLNIEKWHKGINKTSAATNLIELISYGSISK